jgi:hypothetical protein
MSKTSDFSIVYYTANHIPESFANSVRKQLLKSAKGIPIISVSQKPIDFGYNICVGDIGRSALNIYRQATLGAKNAKTKFVAFCEDDVLYSLFHFNYTPSENTFAYDDNIWNIYTWTKPPVFSYKGRINMNGLICERELFITVMEERFKKYNEDNFPTHLFGEPGRYERQMKVKVNKAKFYHSKEPSVKFSHPTELSYLGLGRRKRLGGKPTEKLEPWGSAVGIIELYV